MEFTTSGKHYKVRRTIKPSSFEIYCDGTLIDQNASIRDYQEVLESSILKMNMKSFTQIVILGSSSFVPFMQLSAHARREVIEDLLDLGVFSTMNLRLKERASALNSDISATASELKANREIIREMTQRSKQSKMNREDQVAEIQNKITELEGSIATHQASIRSNEDLILQLQDTITDERELRSRSDELLRFSDSITSKLKRAKKEIEFYEHNESCPTCSQEIDADFRNSKLQEKTESYASMHGAMEKLRTNQSTVLDRLNEIATVHNRISKLREAIQSRLKPGILVNQKEIDLLTQKVQDLSREDNGIYDVSHLVSKCEALEVTYGELASTKKLYEIASLILRDGGVKTTILKKYIPIINHLVNKYLSAMDFFVKFDLDENFEERILSRHRDEFSYDSFSEGEKQKIDIALLLAWREIARLRNTSNCNLLILDEVFDSSLDGNSVEYLIELFSELDERTNIFVISHRYELQEKFDTILSVAKQGNFTTFL